MSGVEIDSDNNLLNVNFIELNEQTEPQNSADGKGRIYQKTGSEGLFWKPNSAGTEVDLTAVGGGSGNFEPSTGPFSATFIDVDLSGFGSVNEPLSAADILNSNGFLCYNNTVINATANGSLNLQFPDSAATYISTLGLNATNPNVYKLLVTLNGRMETHALGVNQTAGTGVTVRPNGFGGTSTTRRIHYLIYKGPGLSDVIVHNT